MLVPINVRSKWDLRALFMYAVFCAELYWLNTCIQTQFFRFMNMYSHTCIILPVVADDHQALIWDIQQMPRAIEDPILAYTAEGEINNVQWASTQPDWIAICYNNCLEILRV